jgi:predicted amidohydrolase YtcJ
MNRRQFLARGSELGSCCAVFGERPATARAQRGSARGSTAGDFALVNAHILTLDEQRPTASAVLVRDGRIALIGDTATVRAHAARAREYDAGGRVVIPGFVDNHCHVEDSCIVGDEQPSIGGMASIADMVARVREVASRTPKGDWVLMQASAADFPDRVQERRWLDRRDLDRATTEHPVMVVLGIHASILNTPGWKLTGYWEPGSDATVRWKTDGSPRLGSHIVRDADGHPAGLATEVWDFRPGYAVAQYKASMRRHFADWFLAKGLTSITTIQDTSPNEFLALQELQAEGGLPVRLRVYPVVPHAVALSDVTRVGWRSGFGHDMFRFGGVKLFVDGIGTDYMGGSLTDLKWSADRLTAALVACQRSGLQAILHVVTEGGLALAFDSLEAARQAAPADLRHRIDHRTAVDDAGIERAHRLGITWGITAPRQRPGVAGTGSFGRVHRYRTLISRGSAIAVLDAAGPGGNYHPMQGIANMLADHAAGGAAPPGEAISLEQALRMWTLWPARNNGEDHEKGSIAVGKFGDFAVLSDDPRGRPPAEVHGITTVATIVGGEVVHERT